MAGFIQPKVKRGRLTNFRTGLFQTFLFNPGRINEKKGVNLSVDSRPGFSDPLVRFASGKVSVIDFTLDLDGYSRLRRDGVQLLNGAKGVAELPLLEASDTFSIAGEIEFYESFQFTVDPLVAPGKLAEPDMVVFTYGRRYQGVLCIVEKMDMDIFEFDTEGNPSKAQLKFSLVRRADRNRRATDIWDVPLGIGIPQQLAGSPRLRIPLFQ